MDKFLVTGAAGFIGSHLSEELLKRGKVVGIDNLSLGTRNNIKHLKKDFTFYEVDILNHKEFENVFRAHSFNAVFHLAACSDISKGDPEGDFRNTFSTTCVLLEKCRVRRIKQFIFTSSSSVYGDRNEVFKEESVLAPVSHYGAAKMSSEAFIQSYCSMYDIQSWILRLPNVIGERMTHGCIFDFKKKLKVNKSLLTVLGDGNQTKSYLYVKDLVDALIFTWQNAKEKVNIYNVAGNGLTSVKFIAELMSENIAYAGGDRGWKGDVPRTQCNMTKLNNLGWFPSMTSDEAVKLTIERYET
jgi:UDP-glucose 4-epimerase